MNIALYSHSKSVKVGGGLIYLMSLAKILANKNKVTVYFQIDDLTEINEVYKGNFSIKKFKRSKIPLFGQLTFAVKEYFAYDLVIQQSLYAPRITFVRNSFILCDFPFGRVDSFNKRFRLSLWKNIIVNSKYTGKYVEKKWSRKSTVIYPPVKRMPYLQNQTKSNLILVIGRITNNNRSKRQDVVIDIFKKIVNQGIYNYEMVLIGYIENQKYLEELNISIKDYPIKIIENCDENVKLDYLKNAKFLISACGYKVNQEKNPDRVEHYGISIVEAMVNGCVPLAVNNGGHKETIDHMINGILWDQREQLFEYLLLLMNDKKLYDKISIEAHKKSYLFSTEYLTKKLEYRLL